MYEMKEEYYTGIDMIDKEHKRLFEIAEETYQLKNEMFLADKYDQIKAILQQLKEYTLMHFDHEEAYMQSIHYKKMFTQKTQHDAFREKIEDWNLDDIDENSEAMIDEILEYLTNWLIGHILENDKQIAE
jgi:hemerythrin